jgi:hypothetical protein
MALPVIDSGSITHGNQLAIAPVFLLTAVSGMIAAVAGRLARIIDRARLVEDRALASTDPTFLSQAREELAELRERGRLANGCIALLTSCALFIGLTIIVLFVGETTNARVGVVAIGFFLLGVFCFLGALACFLAETIKATRILDFDLLR